MSERTSRTIIQRRMQGTGVYRHYSEWTAKDQRTTIQACGLASSKYTNKVKRNEILSHLVKVDLPADPGLVLRALRELNISILGASNRQQFAKTTKSGFELSMQMELCWSDRWCSLGPVPNLSDDYGAMLCVVVQQCAFVTPIRLLRVQAVVLMSCHYLTNF